MISLLMAVYHGEQPAFLDRALQSLVDQSVAPDEVVLVEDGPIGPDLSAVIDRQQDRLPLTRLALPRNIGLAGALNEGLMAARGDWIMRFDTDDVSLPNRVATQSAWIHEGRFDLFGAQIAEFETDPDRPFRTRSVPTDHDQIVRFARKRNPFNHMTICYRKQLALDQGGYPAIPLMEDYALWLMMIAAGARTANDPRTLVLARVGNGMIRRRGGIRYVRSEWRLQALMHRLALKSVLQCTVDGLLRTAVFLAPATVRSLVYRHALRQS